MDLVERECVGLRVGGGMRVSGSGGGGSDRGGGLRRMGGGGGV